MVKALQLMVFVLMTTLVVSIPVQSAFSESGFSNTKKATGVIIKFCSNQAMTMQECDEKYEGYTWTDRVNVLIYAPGWNEDELLIDHIGEAYGSKLTIATRDYKVTTAVFSETGPDTGLFFGVVKLNGQHFIVHNENGQTVKAHGHTSSNYGEDIFDNCRPSTSGGHGHGFIFPLIKLHSLLFTGLLDTFLPSAYAQHMMHKPACSDDIIGSAYDVAARLTTNFQNGAVTVSWEANDNIVVSKTATWTWRMGEISFDKDTFTTDEPVTFTLHDADLWVHHAEFFTYWIRAWSESDEAGIYVPVQFIPNHDHGSPTAYEGISEPLSEPAASSLTKYTPDGKWKIYFWWEPGGVIGVDQDYNLNLMVHTGKTDIHQQKLSYDMEIYFNGELIETRNNRYFDDGHGIEPIRFDERGSVKVVVKNVFNSGLGEDFSFQVAPEAVLQQVVGKHSAFKKAGQTPEFEGRAHGHYIDVLKGEFRVTTDDSSQKLDRLRVSDQDTIYIEYTDLTLPKPFSRLDQVDVTSKAIIYDLPYSNGIINGNADLTSPSEESSITPTQETKPNKVLITPVATDIIIPDWVKKNAAWWGDVKIDDKEFASGIEYLIQQRIIEIPTSEEVTDEDEITETSIPDWVRNNAVWWSEGQISDIEFTNGIQFLISSGLIKV